MEKISKAQVKLVKSLQLKKFRDELNLFVAEGDKPKIGDIVKVEITDTLDCDIMGYMR